MRVQQCVRADPGVRVRRVCKGESTKPKVCTLCVRVSRVAKNAQRVQGALMVRVQAPTS